MSRVVALIDGEHYPPVVRFALDALSATDEVVAAAFIGGTEKVDAEASQDVYGVPVIRGETATSAIACAIERYEPDELVDLYPPRAQVALASRLSLAILAAITVTAPVLAAMAMAGSGFAARFRPATQLCCGYQS